MPVAIASFRMKDQREPYLVVAAGTTLYIYRLMSPFYKLTIPSEKVDPREKAIWCDPHRDTPDSSDYELADASVEPIVVGGRYFWLICL